MFSWVLGAIGVDLRSRAVAVRKSSSFAARCAAFPACCGFVLVVVGGRCDCGCDSVSGTRDVTDRDSLYSVSSCPERKRRILRFMSWVRDGPFFSLVVGARISCS